MTPETALITWHGVALTYSGPPPVAALHPTDLSIGHGEYVAVTGRSGSGKSTVLNVLGLIDRPTAGTYLLAGRDTRTMTESARTSLRAHRIGLVFQAFHLVAHRSATDNVALGLLYQAVPTRQRLARARAALVRVGLADRLTAPPGRLSGGERQRVAIARALVAEPDLLLCDEPTGNLDSATAQEVLDLIEGLRADGLTIVMITHDRAVADRAARRLSIVDGKVSAG
jgi:putative ABC transport system ATP-binding protein